MSRDPERLQGAHAEVQTRERRSECPSSANRRSTRERFLHGFFPTPAPPAVAPKPEVAVAMPLPASVTFRLGARERSGAEWTLDDLAIW